MDLNFVLESLTLMIKLYNKTQNTAYDLSFLATPPSLTWHR